MRERGHSLAVLSRPGARILERARTAGFDTFAVDMRSVLDLPNLCRIRKIIRDFRADVVNTHSGRDTQLAALAARTLGGNRPKIVRTRHLALPITSRFTYSFLPDQVVAVSKFVEDFLVESGVPRAKIVTVRTGIDFSCYDRSTVSGNLRQELGLPADTLLIGTVAILRVKKGHQEILDVVPTVLRRFPDVHFVFAGDGPQMGNLKKRIAAEGLGSRVHMLGMRADVVNVLASLDIFVLPTHQEALGTAFIEAGAMGIPVVASNVDGVPEVVQNGNTGLLVGVRDVNALSESIMHLLACSAERLQMGKMAAAFVRENYSREMMAAGMEAIYFRIGAGNVSS